MASKKIDYSTTILSILFSLILFVLNLFILDQISDISLQKNYINFFNLILTSTFVAIALAWIGKAFYLSLVPLIFGTLNIFLIDVNLPNSLTWLYFVFYLVFWFSFFSAQMKLKERHINENLILEKEEEKFNKLNEKFDQAHHELEVHFSQHANYFKLREVATKFSISLSLKQISRTIVNQALRVINKGDSCLLYLTEPATSSLYLISSKSQPGTNIRQPKLGSVFDQWVLKTQQHLIISDTAKDFRFDYKPEKNHTTVKSLISAPLSNEGRVTGTIRINSSEAETFNTNDLRILNIIGVLASSAIWNALLYKQTEELAIRDSLTHLYVQRYFKERLAEEHRRALISKNPLSILMCDLDYFKSYNDQYGHTAGDILLKSVSSILAETLGDDAFIARYGGEEFAVILINTPKHNAFEIAENLRKTIEDTEFNLRGNITRSTVSIGVATLLDDTYDAQDLITMADRRLYDAKRNGRNQVC